MALEYDISGKLNPMLHKALLLHDEISVELDHRRFGGEDFYIITYTKPTGVTTQTLTRQQLEEIKGIAEHIEEVDTLITHSKAAEIEANTKTATVTFHSPQAAEEALKKWPAHYSEGLTREGLDDNQIAFKTGRGNGDAQAIRKQLAADGVIASEDELHKASSAQAQQTNTPSLATSRALEEEERAKAHSLMDAESRRGEVIAELQKIAFDASGEELPTQEQIVKAFPALKPEKSEAFKAGDMPESLAFLNGADEREKQSIVSSALSKANPKSEITSPTTQLQARIKPIEHGLPGMHHSAKAMHVEAAHMAAIGMLPARQLAPEPEHQLHTIPPSHRMTNEHQSSMIGR